LKDKIKKINKNIILKNKIRQIKKTNKEKGLGARTWLPQYAKAFKKTPWVGLLAQVALGFLFLYFFFS
jgi:hypothetical protein